MPKNSVQDVWKHIDCSGGAEACWPWTGCISRGYGQFGIGGKVVKAHKAAYEAVNGKVPKGLHVLHRCAMFREDRKNIKHCCNPIHLYVGTHADNMRDTYRLHEREQGRGKSKLSDDDVRTVRKLSVEGLRPYQIVEKTGFSMTVVCGILTGKTFWYFEPENIVRLEGTARKGERNGRAKLTMEDVRSIRKRYRDGKTQAELAKGYGVSVGTIAQIVQGKTWKTVSGDRGEPEPED